MKEDNELKWVIWGLESIVNNSNDQDHVLFAQHAIEYINKNRLGTTENGTSL